MKAAAAAASNALVVIDFQAFKSSNNEFIVKEVASFNGTQSLHSIFLPPCKFHELSADCQRQVRWLTNNHHHLYWSDGYVPLNKLPELLEVAVRGGGGADRIFVKGREKAAFIENCLRQRLNHRHHLHHFHPVVCEFPDQPALTARIPYCPFHRAHSKKRERKKTFCALSNVHYLYNLLLELTSSSTS